MGICKFANEAYRERIAEWNKIAADLREALNMLIRHHDAGDPALEGVDLDELVKLRDAVIRLADLPAHGGCPTSGG